MIGYNSNYYKDKNQLQNHIFRDEKFKLARGQVNIHSLKKHYPIEVSYNGMKFRLDEYRGYISGSLPFYFYKSQPKKKFTPDFGYQKLSKTIDILKADTIDLEKSFLSKLHFELSISSTIRADLIIKNNIIMLKRRGYNQNKIGSLNNELKQFQFNEFTLGVYDNNKRKGHNNSLKFILKFKKSTKLRSMGIINVLDLKDKTKLRKLFIEFLKRFDELTIVDSFDDYGQFCSRDQKKMLLYMNVNFWGSFLQSQSGRKARSRATKDFERIQNKHNLNSLKIEMRCALEKRYEFLINN